MAASSSDWDAEVDRWRRVGDLGMEAALRETGCPQQRISKALRLTNVSIFYLDSLARKGFREAGRPSRSLSDGSLSEGRSMFDGSMSDGRSMSDGSMSDGRSMSDGSMSDGRSMSDRSMSDGLDFTTDGHFDSNELDPEAYTDLEISTVLATVGRGSSLVTAVRCYQSARSVPTENDATAFCVNLTTNPTINELLIVSCSVFSTRKVCTLLGNAFAANPKLQVLTLGDLGMGSEALRYLVDGLQLSKALRLLGLNCITLEDERIRLVADLLANNKNLQSLFLSNAGYELKGPKHISSALECNTSLRTLSFGNSSRGSQSVGADVVEGFSALLEPLSRDVGDARPKNTTLEDLNFQMLTTLTNEHPTFVKSLTAMIRTNRTLRRLSLSGFSTLPEIWKEQIFPALKENVTLLDLRLSCCGDLSGEDVFEALMDVLRNSDTALEEIYLGRTGLAVWQSQVDEELRMNKEYRSALRDQRLVPTTSGRMVLCGYEFGGKTAICETMHRIDSGTPYVHHLKMVWKKVLQAFPGVRRFLFGKNAHREIMSRTRGCDISVLEKQEYLKSIWDFAGQREYYALHDYLFPEMKNSCFVFVCSCRYPPDDQNSEGKVKDEEKMKEECEYWLRFLASNAKVLFHKDGQGRQLPRVVFVLTKKDTLGSGELLNSTLWAENVVWDLKSRFKDVVKLSEKVEVVNAHSPNDVSHLLTVVNDLFKETLVQQTEYVVCQQVRGLLRRWSAKNRSKPVLKLEDFYKVCQDQLKMVDPPIPVRNSLEGSNQGWEIVLTYLNDIGEIIFLKGFGFIVTNPRWFGMGILGSLINAFKKTKDDTRQLCCWHTRLWAVPHKDGFVERKSMEVLLEYSLKIMHLEPPLTIKQLIDLMIDLEMCFEQHPEALDSSLFLPVVFDDPEETAAQGRRPLQWILEQSGPFIYLGRRLECKDKYTTFLTPGFFPRLQVHLRNCIHQKAWTSNPGFEVGRNLLRFSENGVDVCVEYSGDIDYFVDILVRSSKPYAEALKFIEEHVVKDIRQFCASPQGCQGVVLVEAVIRPVCVRELHLCVDRKVQSVLISVLQGPLAVDKGYKYTWSQRLPNEFGNVEFDNDFALDLLEGEGTFKSLLKSEGDRTPDIASSSASWSNPSDDLPKLLYPSIEDVGTFRNIATRLNMRKKLAMKLHLWCDYKYGSHEVKEQPGRTIILNWKAGGFDLPIAKHLVTLLYAAVGVGTSLAGVSVAFPQMDSWVNSLFDVPEMPALNGETLYQMMSPRKTPGPILKEEMLEVLKKYLKRDPNAVGLKQFLKLENGGQFWIDFLLHKVVYTEVPDQNMIGWVCDRCYWKGFKQGILKKVHH